MNNSRMRETCLAVMLDAQATRGETSHTGQKLRASHRAGIVSADQSVEVCQAIFLLAHSLLCPLHSQEYLVALGV